MSILNDRLRRIFNHLDEEARVDYSTLCSCCHLTVFDLCHCLAEPFVGRQSVIVAFLSHIQLFFSKKNPRKWDVLSKVKNVTRDDSSRVAKWREIFFVQGGRYGMICFVQGGKNGTGCFDQSGKDGMGSLSMMAR